jgi:cupin fold WbuC family metalloprotein
MNPMNNSLDIITINEEMIDQTIKEARKTPNGCFRICLHSSINSPIQQMVIAFTRKTYFPPHRHPNKTESYHILSGRVVVVFFSDEGDIVHSFIMDKDDKKSVQIYRQNGCYWHTIVVLSDFAVIHEIVNGPYIKIENEYVGWAPSEEDNDAKDAFRKKVIATLP